MTDKELIKQEIERRIVQAEEFAERAKGANDDSSKLSWDFVATQNKSLLQFIDSLPEESGCVIDFTTRNEELEEALGRILNTHYYFPDEYDELRSIPELAKYIAYFFAEWQKQQMMKNTVLETKVMMDYDGDGIEIPYYRWLTLENTEILSLPDNIRLKEGDKVKIIVVKTEQQ